MKGKDFFRRVALEVGDTIVSEETIAETRAQMGLDKPFHIQYLKWRAGVLQGDIGLSYSAKMPVAERLWQGLQLYGIFT